MNFINCFQLGFFGIIVPQKMNVELHNLFHRDEGAKVRYLNYAATANNKDKGYDIL